MQAAGMNEHIGKPIDPRLLFKTLARCLALATATAGAKEKASSASSTALVLPGIDVEECLERLGDNMPLFRQLLAYFSSNYGQVAQNIRDLLAVGSRTDAIRLAHSVKGAAGNLSIVGVQQAAARVELALFSGEEGETDRINELHQAIQLAFDAIDAGLSVAPMVEKNGEEEERQGAQEIDPEVLKTLLTELRARAVGCDPTSEDFFTEHQKTFAAGLPPALFGKLSSQIENYRFAEAVDTIASLLAKNRP